MVSLYGHMMNLILRCMPQNQPGQPHDYAAERKRNDREPPRPPKGVTVTEITLNGLSGEKIIKTGNDRGMVFYIHGGGFTTGSAKERRAVCQYIAAQTGFNVISFNYRLAPENLWPAPLEDCLTAYQALLESGAEPGKTVFMGESAGGTLVLSLALYLKEKGLPQPGTLVSFSPCVTMAETLPSHTANIRADYMLRDSVANGEIRIVLGEHVHDEAFLHRPTVSPLYGDYVGLPPIFLAASDTETLLDDSKVLYKKLTEEGHKAQLDIRHGVCHAFQMFPAMPEAKQSLHEAFRFIDSCI